MSGSDFALVRLRHELAEKSGPLQMNSFVPEVRGRIVGTAEGARMEGTMMLRPIVLILMLVWIAALLGGFISLIVSGLSNRAIATRLTVGDETVKSHLRSIYRKLAVNDRAGAVAAALREGIFQ